MLIQVYRCPVHGEFKLTLRWDDLVFETRPCPVTLVEPVAGKIIIGPEGEVDQGVDLGQCQQSSPRIQQVPGTSVPGGTTPTRPPGW